MCSAAKIPDLSNEQICKKHPNIVVDFMLAQQEAVAALSAGELWHLVEGFWKPDPEDGAKAVNDDLIFACGRVLPTLSGARAVQQASQYLVGGGAIAENLSRDAVKRPSELPPPLANQACAKLGQQTPNSEFTRTDVDDLRGLPLSNMD